MSKSKQIFNDGDLMVFDRAGVFFLRYDSGAHQVKIREDEITLEDAKRVMSGEQEATKVLFELQERLEAAGIKPNESNV